MTLEEKIRMLIVELDARRCGLQEYGSAVHEDEVSDDDAQAKADELEAVLLRLRELSEH